MGGSSKQTVGYWYYWAMHFGWCRGPIDALLEWRAGDKTAWSGRVTASTIVGINQPNLWGGESDQGQGGVQGQLQVMFGEQTQPPNERMKQVFNSGVRYNPFGDALAALFHFPTAPPPSATQSFEQQSAHRGKFTTFYSGKFGAYSPNPKPVSAKVERILTDWQDGVVWYPEKAIIPMQSPLLADDSQDWQYVVLPDESNPGTTNLTPPESGWMDAQAPFAGGTLQASGHTVWPTHTVLWARISFNAQYPQRLTVVAENGCVIFINGTQVGAVNQANASIDDNQANTFIFDLQPSAATEILVKAFDETEAGGGTFLSVHTQSISDALNAMNPAHILYDSITHEDMQGEPTGLINDASFRAAADNLYAEGFGLCTDYDASAETPLQFQQRICNVIGASLSQSRVDGLYYLDLIRTPADIDILPVISEDDIVAFSQDASVITETGNMMRVEWTDPTAKEDRTTAPIYAMGNVQSAGRVIACDPKTYHEIPSESLALRVAARDLKASATPLAKFTLDTKGTLRGLRPGMNARLQVPSEGIADLVVVIGSVAHGTASKGQMKIVAVQNVYSLPATVYVQPQPGAWVQPDTTAVAAPQQRAFEAPYVELAQTLSAADLAALTADVGYLLTVAGAPMVGDNYLIDTAAAGEDYVERGSGDWCPTATVPAASSSTDTVLTLADDSLLDHVAVGSWALWDDEIVRVDAVDPVALTATVARGCADTVPAPHAAGSRIYLCGEWVSTDRRLYVGGDTVGVKLLTRTATDQQDVASATALSVAFNERQARPYPPGNLTINGERYPASASGDLVLAWSHRDRLLSADQLVDTLQADVGPEAGTTYTVRVYLGGALDSTTSDLTATTLTPTVSSGGSVRVEVEAQRDGLASWQPLAADFAYSAVELTLAGTFAAATIDAPYASDLTIAGGDGSYSNPRVTVGSLDGSGLALSIVGAALRLSGTPAGTPGTLDITVAVDSTDGQTATSAQSITIAAAPPADVYATLNANDIGPSLILSGDLLTVTTGNGASGPWSSVRANIGLSTGKHYFEVTNAGNGNSGGDGMWGFMSAADSLVTYPGNAALPATSMGWEGNNYPDSARFQHGGLGAVSGYSGLQVGSVAYFAIDLDGGKLWVRNSNVAGWAGGGDPAAGTAPTFTFTPGTELFPALGTYASPQTSVANFGASAFNGTVPTGFASGWKGPRPAGVYTSYTSRFTTSGTSDAQGVATDGTSVWFANSTTIFKYTKAGVLVTSRDVSGDSPTDKSQINGLFIKDGVLYVSAAKFASGVATAWVVEYDPDTLAYSTQHSISSDKFSEGLAFKDGYWWVVFHANEVVCKYDTTWTLVATYTLTFPVTGSSGGYGAGTGYDGIAWVGDYLLCNIHEIYNEDFLDIYHWNGSGFDKISRQPRISTIATQGICVDPVESGVLWFAERNGSGTDSVAKATYLVV